MLTANAEFFSSIIDGSGHHHGFNYLQKLSLASDAKRVALGFRKL